MQCLRAMFICLIIPGPLSASISSIDSLKKVLPGTQGKEKLIVLHELGLASKHFNLVESRKYFKEAIRLAEQLGDIVILGNLYNNIGNIESKSGHYDLALKYELKSLEFKKQSEDINSVAYKYNNIAAIYSSMGHQDSSYYFLQKALEIFITNENLDGLGQVYNNIAVYYNDHNHFDTALAYHLKALENWETLGDSMEMAGSYNNIALIHSDNQNLEKSLEYNLRAKKIYETYENWYGLTFSYTNLAINYFDKGQLDSARFYNLASINASEKIGDTFGPAYNYFNLASIEKVDSNYEQALDYFQQALDLWVEQGDVIGVAYVYSSMGQCLYAKGDMEAAIESGLNVVKMDTSLYSKLPMREAYEALYNSYAAIGNYPEGFRYLKALKTLEDTLFSKQKSKQIAELQTRYETEKKDRELALQKLTLEHQSTKIEQQQSLLFFSVAGIILLLGIFVLLYLYIKRGHHKKQMEAQLRTEKKLLELEQNALRAQMNPHFIFNTLESINSYILTNNIEQASDFLVRFSKLIRHILENSREHFITLESEIRMLTNYLDIQKRCHGNKFDFKVEVDPDMEIEAIGIPTMIIQPYVENAIVHGVLHKQGHGHILLRFQQRDHSIFVTVQDNGVGRSKARELKESSGSYYKSVGMLITRERIEMLNQKNDNHIVVDVEDLTDENGQPAGTKGLFAIPLKPYLNGHDTNDHR